MAHKPQIIITAGDAGGVGPELVVQAFAEPSLRKAADLVVVGDAAVLQAALRVSRVDLTIEAIKAPGDAAGAPAVVLPVLDLGLVSPKTLAKGEPDPLAGESSVAAIHLASDLAANGDVDAIVSAPANKISMNSAGHAYPGQTEIFLERWNIPGDSAHIMLLAHEMRVSLVTAHCSMREAVDRVRKDRVLRIGRQCVWTLKNHFAIDDPLIGVAGLNCHAGDGGLFGREEIEEIAPAIEILRGEGIRLTDPQPADALFYKAGQGAYEGVLGMYHDQGAIPLKRSGYVTVIAGVPFIRTTCGHGTAYDIAWKGVADPRLFIRAVQTAINLVEARRAV